MWKQSQYQKNVLYYHCNFEEIAHLNHICSELIKILSKTIDIAVDFLQLVV